MPTHAALADHRFLAAIGPERRSGHSAQPPLPPGRSRRDGTLHRRLVAVSWTLVALMLAAIAVIALIG